MQLRAQHFQLLRLLQLDREDLAGTVLLVFHHVVRDDDGHLHALHIEGERFIVMFAENMLSLIRLEMDAVLSCDAAHLPADGEVDAGVIERHLPFAVVEPGAVESAQEHAGVVEILFFSERQDVAERAPGDQDESVSGLAPLLKCVPDRGHQLSSGIDERSVEI